MNTMFRTAALAAALAFASTATQADVICDTCAYQRSAPATYLGEYNPGDRGSFINLNVAAHVGPDQPFEHFYVVDLQATAYVDLTVSTVAGEGFATPWRVEMFYDLGNNGDHPTVCPDPTPGSACTFTPWIGLPQLGDSTDGKRFSLP